MLDRLYGKSGHFVMDDYGDDCSETWKGNGEQLVGSADIRTASSSVDRGRAKGPWP